MPTVNITLPDITQSVIRPIVIDVMTQLKEWTKISQDVPIFYGNDAGQLQTAGSGLDNKDDRLMRSDNLRRIELKATETFAEDQQITDITGKKGNVQIFRDDTLGIWMAPAYVSSKVVMEIEFKTRSKEEAHRWRDEVNAKYLRGRQSIPHRISYSYNLPVPAWELLDEFHKKREGIAGYGDSFHEYLHKCISNRLTIISNETGSNLQFTIAESQDRIQGYFGFSNDPDKAEYDQTTGMWNIRFNYSFVYQRASTLDVHYPIIIHQQVLEKPFIEFVNKKLVPDDRAYTRSQWLWGLEQFESTALQIHFKPQKPYIRIPFQDDFKLNYTFPGTATFMLVLLQQQQLEQLAFNLAELGDICIDPDILDFIKQEEYKHIGKPGKSIFHFDVYRGYDLCSDPAVTIDENLNVSLTMNVDPRKPYRVRCAVYTDLSFIDRAALDRLMFYPKAFLKVLSAINELLVYDSDFQKLGNQKKIYPWQLTRLYEVIMGQAITNIYKGVTPSFVKDSWGTNWTNDQRTFMTEIPERLLKTYRSARTFKGDQQIFGIAAFNKNKPLPRFFSKK